MKLHSTEIVKGNCDIVIQKITGSDVSQTQSD